MSTEHGGAGGVGRFGRRRAWAIAAGVVLAIGVATVWRLSTLEEGRRGADWLGWEAGDRQRYALEIDSRIGLVLPSESGSRLERLEQSLRGALHLRVFGVEGAGVRVGFQLARIDYRLLGERESSMESGLAVPFTVLFAPNGRPASFAFPEGMDAAPRALLEELVRTFQLVEPGERAEAGRAPRAWTSSEEHAMGRYLAYHERRPDGRIRKRKTQYSRVDLPFGSAAPAGAGGRALGAPQIDLQRSDATYRLARGVAWVEHATLDEQLLLRLGARRVGDAVVAAELRLESTRPTETLALYADEDWRAILLAASEDLRSGAAAGDALASATGIHDWIDALDAPTSDRVRARARLEDALRADPGLAQRVADAVRGGTSADVAASMIHALERVGHPEAQRALVGLMQDPGLERRRRLQSTVALGGVTGAGDGTIDALLDMSRATVQGDLATTALLAAGAIGQTLRDVDPSRAAGLGEALQGRLRDAEGAQGVGVALKAMGNMADPGFAETVVPYVRHDSPYVRASAAWTLERTGATEQAPALVDRLAVEESGRVRSALVSALDDLGTADAEAIAVVSGAVLDEPDPNVRLAMVRYLGRHLEAHPENRDLLALVALEDASGSVRRLAASTATGGGSDD